MATILQDITVQEALRDILQAIRDGDACTTSARPIGRVAGPDGEDLYTVAIMATCDTDSTFYEEELPVRDDSWLWDGAAQARTIPGQFPVEDRKKRPTQPAESKPEGLQRYVCFFGDSYYAGGGWNDYAANFAALSEAVAWMEKLTRRDSSGSWAHIVDTHGRQDIILTRYIEDDSPVTIAPARSE